MRLLPVAYTTLVLALAAPPMAGASDAFFTTLDGLQEVPPTPYGATGTVSMWLNDAQTQLTYHIEFTGLSSAEIEADIRNAPPGVNGPVVFSLPLGSPKDGVWDIPPAMVTELYADRLYVDIHTVTYAAGEIRGGIHSSLPVESSSMGRVKARYER